jgi:hypothetical protein
VGQKVTFRISQYRAIDIEHSPDPEPSQTIPEQPQQEFKNEPLDIVLDSECSDTPLTTMTAAFQKFQEK